MMLLVNVLVEGTPVQATVSPVMESVLKHKEKSNLPCHLRPAGERNAVCRHAKILADRMEAPNLRCAA